MADHKVADAASEPVDTLHNDVEVEPRSAALAPPVAAPVTIPLAAEDADQPLEREQDESSAWTEPRLTSWQQAERAALVAVALLIVLVLVAPIVLALVAMVWALVTDSAAAVNVARLLREGRLLETEPAMNSLSVASRIGFVAIGYLGYFFALMALLAGLLGRGRGRLFIIPGALLTGSALILLFTSGALAWPLITLLGASHGALAALAFYALLDAVALATTLADTRYTRRQWRRARRSVRSWRSWGGASQRDEWAALTPADGLDERAAW